MNRTLRPRTVGGWRSGAAAVLAGVLVGAWLGAPTPAPAQESKRAAAYKVAVTDARRAMAKRELDDASKALKLASENSHGQEEKDEIARLESMLDYLRQFWQLLAKGAEKMKAGDELDVAFGRGRKLKMAFVESVAGGVTFRVEGVNRLFTWKTMPSELVVALADKSLAKNKVSKVVLGAFLAMDEKGDRAQARKLLEEAARSGLDVSHLIAELDAMAAGGGKAKVPADDKLKTAEAAVKEEYKRLYSRSGIQSYQEELARKLLADGPKVTDDDAKRFVMLREARDLAAGAGNLRAASAAIEQMAAYYQLDVLKMKIEMLKKAADGARGPEQFRDVVLLCLNLADEARQTRRTAEARQAVEIAIEAARNSKSRALMQQAAAAEQKLGSGKK